MQLVINPRLSEPVTRRTSPAEGDYRVKIFKAAARSAHDEVERAQAALAERGRAERLRTVTLREAEVRGRAGR